MKKIFCLFLIVLCVLYLFSACNTKEVGKQNNVNLTNEVQKYIMPLSFSERDDFLDSILSDHVLYNESEELSDYNLAEIQYYLDFVSLPEGAQLNNITVDKLANYITLSYDISGAEISLTWYRADFGAGYNHFNSSKVATSDLPQETLLLDDAVVLQVHHQQDESTLFDHYSYHWEQDGDYIDLVVDSTLINEYGAESFLSVGKVNVDFGDITPAVVD
ncbi:MAG: hypothetical protein E7388_06250 [Ruminococcaceae bacterium]|nr:hypothetical protein [Oscillospiraceae bacterium]